MSTRRKNCLNAALRVGLMIVGFVAVLAVEAALSIADAQGRNVTSHGRSGGMALDIPINKSDVLRSNRPFFEVAVGNPEIADVQVLGERSLYVFGRKFGSTSVTLSDNAGRIIAVVDVNVIHDVSRVKRMLHQLMPQERIAVRAANDGLVLSGTVSSSTVAANAVAIAERFAPEAVSNLMAVQGSQQVMLAVKFVEMRRDAIKRLGFNSAGSVAIGAVNTITDITTALVTPASIAQLGANLTTGNGTDVTAFLDVLEERGVVRTLAEPTLVAMSGDTADFLAGGEFPVPVGATDGEIKIEFKNFGVGLSFTPTVLSGERMNLRLFMEVSEPDETEDFSIVGIRIPGLTVRRATTTIELNNAESFAIAGLLSESFSDNVGQVPFVGDLPILGALTRSTQYQTGQTELVMIVTPYLVKPVSGDRLRAPAFRPPSEQELFLGGTTENPVNISPQLHNSAGFSGAHGYSTW
ncbi:MAG: type II and III secretion system protein family protein [Pseudomonadota bacterium]